MISLVVVIFYILTIVGIYILRVKRPGAERPLAAGAPAHLQAFLNTNVGQGLVNGSTAIAMDWDYDVALLKQKQPKIEWVAPTEGIPEALVSRFNLCRLASENLSFVPLKTGSRLK